jgi:hypothetical protein
MPNVKLMGEYMTDQKINHALTESLFNVGLAAGTTSNGASVEPMSIEKLEQALQKMRGIPPANWILMAPDGTIYKGTDPVELVTRTAVRLHRTN